MKKPEILIGDFIRFNAPSLNNMTTQASEVAAAFAMVMKQIAIKYGNIALPGSTTTGVIDETKLLELTKDDIANGIVGDIVKTNEDDEGTFVITDVKFKDTFNNTFEVEVTLKPFTRNLKNKNKGIVTPLKDYYKFFVNPYDLANLKPETDIVNKRYNCITDLLSSMPLFKFKKGNEDAKQYVFLMDIRTKTINKNAGYYDKSYWFKEVNTLKDLHLSCDEVIKMFFNEEINKDKLVCTTYLLPLLFQKNLYEIKATDMIGIKVIPVSRLNNTSPQRNFYTIDKLISNKPKNKVYALIEYDSSGVEISNTTRTITPDMFETIFRNFYTGIWNSGECFIESPFEKTTPIEFMGKFRTYCEEDYENIFGYFNIKNYLEIINRIFDNTDKTRYNVANKDLTNYDISNDVFGGFKESMYLKELLETKLSFENGYRQEQELPFKLFKFLTDTNKYVFKDGKFNYEFATYSRTEFFKMFTVLPQSPKIGSYRSAYQQPKIHLANIPLKPGMAIMYVKGIEFNSAFSDYVFNEIYEYSSVELDLKKLNFKYTPEGNIANVNDKKELKYDFITLIEHLKMGAFKILEKQVYKKVFNKEIGAISFNIGESFLFSEYPNVPAENIEIVDRNIVPSSNYSITGKLQIRLKKAIGSLSNSTLDYASLFNFLNPYNLKTGDKVTVDGAYVSDYLKLLIEKANQPYYEIVKPRYAKSNPVISVSQSHYDTEGNYDSTYYYNLIPYDQSTTVTQPIQETYGLKIGDNLPKEVISSWAKENNNYYSKRELRWSQESATVFNGDRTIQGFEMLDGQLGFLVSGTQDIYLKAEGFKEFLEGKTQKQVTNSNNITSSLLPGLEIYPLELGQNTQQEALDKIKMFTGDWRLPTAIEMNLMNSDPNIDVEYDKYWINQPETVYSCNEDKTKKVLSKFEKWHYRMVKGSFNPNKRTTTTSSANGISQNIDTIPREMSVNLRMEPNMGNRNSPTQSAGELKTMIKGSKYETEVLNAYYMGNDGDWYKLNVEKNGVWKWKKAVPQPTQNATTTLNKDYASMSQEELKNRIEDTKIAMEVFDEEDEEYKTLATELDLMKLYIFIVED